MADDGASCTSWRRRRDVRCAAIPKTRASLPRARFCMSALLAAHPIREPAVPSVSAPWRCEERRRASNNHHRLCSYAQQKHQHQPAAPETRQRPSLTSMRTDASHCLASSLFLRLHVPTWSPPALLQPVRRSSIRISISPALRPTQPRSPFSNTLVETLAIGAPR